MIPIATSIAGLLVAISSLALSIVNTINGRNNNDASTIYDIWSKYEKYSKELSVSSENTEGTDALSALLNLLNFIENSCYIYNNSLCSPRVKHNIFVMITDFLTGEEKMADLSAVRDRLKTSESTFSETAKFKKENYRIIAQKGHFMNDSLYKIESESEKGL